MLDVARRAFLVVTRVRLLTLFRRYWCIYLELRQVPLCDFGHHITQFFYLRSVDDSIVEHPHALMHPETTEVQGCSVRFLTGL